MADDLTYHDPLFVGTSTGILPFFAATYNRRTIAIRRSTEYDVAINSVRAAFPPLAKIPAARIVLSARFADYGDSMIQITRDLWADVVSLLRMVEISIDEEEGSKEDGLAMRELVPMLNNIVSDMIEIDVQSGPATFSLTLPADSTIRYLKSIIVQNNSVHTATVILSAPGFSLLQDDQTLHAYSIEHKSKVTVITNIRVYVTTPQRSQRPIMATFYATVSSLKLVVSTLSSIFYPQCTLTLAGQKLDDDARLDSYPGIVPECEIVIEVREGIYFMTPLVLYVKPTWAEDDRQRCEVYSKSIVLDLKLLLYNINMISPDRQMLSFAGKDLEDQQILQQQGIQENSTLHMRMYSDGPKHE